MQVQTQPCTEDNVAQKKAIRRGERMSLWSQPTKKKVFLTGDRPGTKSPFSLEPPPPTGRRPSASSAIFLPSLHYKCFYRGNRNKHRRRPGEAHRAEPACRPAGATTATAATSDTDSGARRRIPRARGGQTAGSRRSSPLLPT